MAAQIHIKQMVRPRYAQKTESTSTTEDLESLPTIVQSPIPLRLIPKGVVDESLIAQIIVEKIQFHMPVHRFTKKLKQLGIDFIKEKNLNNWLNRTA
jgi:transposase